MLRYIEVTESDILFNYGNSLISPGRGKKQSHPHQVGFIDLDWRYIFLLRVLILFVDYEDVTLLTFICSICIATPLLTIPAVSSLYSDAARAKAQIVYNTNSME